MLPTVTLSTPFYPHRLYLGTVSSILIIYITKPTFLAISVFRSLTNCVYQDETLRVLISGASIILLSLWPTAHISPAPVTIG
jgi:hypothetical protein